MSSLLFWSLVLSMTLAAMAFLLLPLIRKRAITEVTRKDINIALYRERLAELEQAAVSSDEGAEVLESARQELAARLLADIGAGNPTKATLTSWPKLALATSLAIVLPLLAIGIYVSNSDWQLALAGSGPEAVPLLLRRLEQHLEQQPGDADGWRVLARSRAGLGQFEAAAASYARLNALAADADGLASEAEMRAMARNGNLQGEPEALLVRALRQDPGHARSLWFLGLAARQRGDQDKALKHWQVLAAQELPEDFRQLLNTQITQAGGKPVTAARPKAQATRIAVKVSLASGLQAQAEPGMALFVYARAPGQAGPPLAASRHQVAELPLYITLDDSLAMLPDRKLSSVDRWVITARISRQGSAETRSGDLLGEREVTRAQLSAPVQLQIDRVVP